MKCYFFKKSGIDFPYMKHILTVRGILSCMTSLKVSIDYLCRPLLYTVIYKTLGIQESPIQIQIIDH